MLSETLSAQNQKSITRTFRDLSDDERKDPEVLLSLASFGWSRTIDWDALLASDRIMLLSEAGAGKTFECQEQANRLSIEGKPAFFVELVALAATPFDQLLSPQDARIMAEWRNGKHGIAYFFLDSIDEMELSHGKFRSALRNLANAIDGHEGKAKVVVTSRPIAIDHAAFHQELPIPSRRDDVKIVDPRDRFEGIIRGESRKAKREAEQPNKKKDVIQPWRTVALMPLSNHQIDQMLVLKNVKDGDALKSEIEKRRVWDFARRPQDLIEICAYWNEHRTLGNRAEQVAQNIAAKLLEAGNRQSLVGLSEEKALEGSERLALALAFTRRKSIRVSSKSLDDLESDIALNPDAILSDWSAKERKELLQRGLFGFASYGRVRFHHRSVLEFLAAQRLHKLTAEMRMPTSALLRLLFGEKYGQPVVFPAMRPIAVWLALWNDHVRNELIAREPEALIEEGDPESFPHHIKNEILAAFAKRYGSSDWRGLHFPYDQVRRFAGPELSPTVRSIWNDGITNPDIEELVIDIVQAGRIKDCLDIAHAIASNIKANSNNRVTAMIAISEMDTAEHASPVAISILDPANQWTESARQNLLETLFPKHLSVDQFCELLQQFSTSKRETGGPTWHLPRIFSALELDSALRADLRTKVSELIRGTIVASDQYPEYQSKYSYLGSGLAALCQVDLENGSTVSDELIKACVTASRCHESEYGDEKPISQLRQFFAQAPTPVRERAYRAESAFCREFWPAKEAWDHAYHTAYHGLVNAECVEDFYWLLIAASDQKLPLLEREAVFQIALRVTGREPELIERCRLAATGSPPLEAALDKWLAPRDIDADHRKWEEKHARQRAENKAKEGKRIDGWHGWRDKVIANPGIYFGKKNSDTTIANLWHILESEGASLSRRANWNKAVIAEIFNADIAKIAEQSFVTYWRKHTIPLYSERSEEEKNSYYYKWLYGLAGVYAEAENDPNWALHLTPKEAEKAARYIPLDLNKLPEWFDALIAAQPKAVDRTLGNELTIQLGQALTFKFPGLISDYFHATETIRNFFRPRVWQWLSGDLPTPKNDEEKSRLYEHVDRGLAWLLKTPTVTDEDEIATLAKQRVKLGLTKPLGMLWLIALLTTKPASGVKGLTQGLKRLSPKSRYRFSEAFFSKLGERHDIHFGPNLSDPNLSASDIHHLVRLAYQEITIASDINRSGGGVYSPNQRDNAQRGRDAVLSALLNKSGPDAWAIKLAMRADPLFAHFKDRLDHLARERVASEAEGEPLTEADVSQLDRYGEAPPADRDGMFELMIDRLADIEHDLVADFNERALLSTIAEEHVMQHALALRLHNRANNSYKVDREAEVANAKKTDIRLRSMRSNQQAVIELKLANNGWTVSDFLTALEQQLVGQYLQHKDCKAGCLLITIAKTRTWDHPDTKERIGFDALIELLNEQAVCLSEQLGYSARIKVVGIDLRPSKN
jgi:hypothetical protein